MRSESKAVILNIAVMAVILSVGSIVLAARNERKAPLVSFEVNPNLVMKPATDIALMGEPDYSYYATPTPIPTVPPTFSGPCLCSPPAPPGPTPVDFDVPPALTPTPDTSGATGTFTITINPFL